MKWKWIAASLFLAAVPSCHAAPAGLHVHPVPSLPVNFDPATADDVFSISAVWQIHRALFKIDSNSVPLPMLVSSFTVSRDQLHYAFELRDTAFHDGHPLKAEDVVYSLERAISKRVPGYDRLQVIEGFAPFLSGTGKGLRGLSSAGPRQFKIDLVRPYPALIETLADVRFSILRRAAGSVTVGLGPYELKSRQPASVALARRPGNRQGPAVVKYVRSNQNAAIKAFEHGEVQDLFAYSLKESEVGRLREHAIVQLIQSPRTYLVAVNPLRFKTLQDRELVLGSVDAARLTAACYSGNSPTQSIVPPGFPGYVPPNKPAPQARPSTESSARLRPLRVAIAQGVDSEDCVRARLQEDLGRVAKGVSVEVTDTETALDRWRSGQADVLFLYLEAENTLDMYQLFNPKSYLSFGVAGDTVMEQQLAAYHLADDPVERERWAEDMNKHILGLKTVLPLFHPKQFIVYSSRYKPMKVGIRSSTFLDFTALEGSAR